MSDTLEIPLKELKDWLKKETAPKIEPIRTEGKARLNDLKTKMAELQESCEKLLEDSEKEMLKSNPKTYRRARAAYKFARDVLQAIDQQEAPNSITYESLKDFCEEWGRMFTEIGEERARKFRRISPYFILDRRSFDGTLKKSVESFRELRDFLSQGYEEAKAIEGSFRAFDNLDLALKELEKIGKRKKRAE
nr:hypothetical protein [Desulfobacterales bacterium]